MSQSVIQFPAVEATEQPVGNFIRAYAGVTLTAAEILEAHWPRIIKVCWPEGRIASSPGPARIELPPARRWGKELVVVDSSGMGYVLAAHDGEAIHGTVARPVVALRPVLADRHGEGDSWAAS